MRGTPAIVAVLVMTGCGSNVEKQSACASDLECKGDRVCIDGECDAPSTPGPQPDADSDLFVDMGADATTDFGRDATTDSGGEAADVCVDGCIACGPDTFVMDHACVVCPAGTANAAGDDASGADTNCDAVTCAANQRVASNVCTTCPPGSTNAAGDDASGADTSCDAVICAADQRVSSNICVTCSAGTTNSAGDDASGADTSCAAVFCAVNQRVSSNTCATCPAGTTNAAGDDASGVDTTCDSAINAQSSISPNQGPVGTVVTHTFTSLTNFTLDPNAIGGANADGFGHYHIYVDIVDADHQLLVSGISPDTFTLEITSTVLAAGAHNLILKLHKNDHTEFTTPIEYTIPFTITP